MVAEDHLDTETSVSAELTETGVKAKAKSRFVAAVDRFAGNVVEWGNVLLEKGSSKRRAQIDGERQLIEAVVKYGVERVGRDEDFAKRALENHFSKVAKAQINKDEVLREALEDLRRAPPTEAETSTGPEQLDDHFMNRLESFAESASTDELRQRWGRVLASEVRAPGTFSAKVLRATDELDADAAKLFEQLQQYRIKDTLTIPIMSELNFADKLLLVSAGLLVDPGFSGHVSQLIEGEDNTGEKLWMYTFGDFALAFKKSVPRTFGDKTPFKDQSGTPAIPIYILSDVGRALSSILPSDENKAGLALLQKVQEFLPKGELRLYKKESNGQMTQVPI